MHLKENRNVLPIKIRDIISFLTRKNRSSTVVEQVLASQGNPSYSEKQYYAYLKQKTDKIGYHVKGDTIRQLILGTVESTVMDQDEQKFYNKVIRILLCKYLNGQSILVALNSNRIKSCQKIEHLRANR